MEDGNMSSIKPKPKTTAFPRSDNRISKEELEKDRAMLDGKLREEYGKPISEKAKLDIATLEAVRAVKH